MAETKLQPHTTRKADYLYASFVPVYSRQATELLTAMQTAGIPVVHGGDTSALAGAKWFLLLIGNETPQEETLRDVNFALDHGIQIFCVFVEETELDPGLSLQLGLTEKLSWDQKTAEHILRQMTATEEVSPPRKSVRWLWLFAAVLVVVSGLFLLLRPTEDAPPVPTPAADAAVTESGIEMEPALLSALIENGLDTNNDGILTREELAAAQKLDLSSQRITDIAPLGYCADLTELDLHDNAIQDISVLAAMPHLQKADLSGNCITDFQVLPFLSELTDCNIDGQKEVHP